MKYWLVCLMFLLFTSPIFASREEDARAALALCMATPAIIKDPDPPPPTPEPIQVDTYTNARKMAMVTSKPLVVFIGCPSKTLPNSDAIVITVPKLDGVDGSRILVGKPGVDNRGDMTVFLVGDLPTSASEQDIYDILNEVRKQKVIQQAINSATCVGGT